MSYYLPFDPQHETVAFLAGYFAGQPGIAAMAQSLGCHPRMACRIVAEKLYATGTRTTLVGDMRFTHRVDNPIGPLDDGPGPGGRADIAA